MPVSVAVTFALRQGLDRRLVEPPEVAPGIKDPRDPVAAVKVGDGSHDARAELDSLV